MLELKGSKILILHDRIGWLAEWEPAPASLPTETEVACNEQWKANAPMGFNIPDSHSPGFLIIQYQDAKGGGGGGKTC